MFAIRQPAARGFQTIKEGRSWPALVPLLNQLKIYFTLRIVILTSAGDVFDFLIRAVLARVAFHA
jgi:hypothetical protein